MRLLTLSSNNPNFKTLTFKAGLNILAGLQLTGAEKQTYNGVGKSFSLKLIHLLFGSTLNKKMQYDKKVFEFLANYGLFFLEFSHKGTTHKIQKNFSETYYFLDGKKLSKTKYRKKLRDIFFNPSFDKNISFRQVLNVFARRYGGAYYNEALSQQGMPLTDFYQRYVNLSLLHIDTRLVLEKRDIKEKLNQLAKAKKIIEDYDCSLEEKNIKDLKDLLKNLIKDKEQFIIAENYDKLKQQADKITQELNHLRNTLYDLNKKLARKKASLEQSSFIEVDLEKIKAIYHEAKFFFDEKVSVRLDEAATFHRQLMDNRERRLKSEITDLNEKIKRQHCFLIQREKDRDLILKDLDSKGALEEYNSINERIRSLEEEIRKLEKYKHLLADFKSDKIALELQNATLNAQSIAYLKETKSDQDKIENTFRALVKKFYANHGGTFEIKDTIDAKYLFDIDIHIPRDGSQGIKEVEIFCYDFLLYQLNPDLLGFIAHDGCIFSEMDPRQKSMLLKVALEQIHHSDLQYFINIGQASLEEILDKDNKTNILSDAEKEEINNSVILKLYDKDPSHWLLGRDFA